MTIIVHNGAARCVPDCNVSVLPAAEQLPPITKHLHGKNTAKVRHSVSRGRIFIFAVPTRPHAREAFNDDLVVFLLAQLSPGSFNACSASRLNRSEGDRTIGGASDNVSAELPVCKLPVHGCHARYDPCMWEYSPLATHTKRSRVAGGCRTFRRMLGIPQKKAAVHFGVTRRCHLRFMREKCQTRPWPCGSEIAP